MQNIVLVGPMGAGKSTVGRGLALLLKREFVDSDQEIEKRTGVDIPTIFEFEGEEGFRHRETEMLRELLGREDVVLATGGGIVMRPENRELLQQHCVLYPNYCRTPTLWTGPWRARRLRVSPFAWIRTEKEAGRCRSRVQAWLV